MVVARWRKLLKVQRMWGARLIRPAACGNRAGQSQHLFEYYLAGVSQSERDSVVTFAGNFGEHGVRLSHFVSKVDDECVYRLAGRIKERDRTTQVGKPSPDKIEVLKPHNHTVRRLQKIDLGGGRIAWFTTRCQREQRNRHYRQSVHVR